MCSPPGATNPCGHIFTSDGNRYHKFQAASGAETVQWKRQNGPKEQKFPRAVLRLYSASVLSWPLPNDHTVWAHQRHSPCIENTHLRAIVTGSA